MGAYESGTFGGVMLMKRTKISPFALVVAAFLVVYTLVLFVPMIWGVNVSLKTANDATLSPFSVKFPLQFKNYLTVFNEFMIPIDVVQDGIIVGTTNYYMEHMLWFTFVYAVCCSFINMAVTCIVAYITARYDYRICKIIDGIVIVAMILPIVGSMPSELRIMRALGMYDSLWGMMIMKANFVGGTTFLIFNVAFKALPKDFSEAAQIDGASNLDVMLTVMLPMAKTTFFTMWLLSFINYWNDYQTPLLYFPSKPTLSYGLFRFTTDTSGAGVDLPLSLASCYMLMIPILVVFLFTSEKLIGNVSMGGLKE